MIWYWSQIFCLLFIFWFLWLRLLFFLLLLWFCLFFWSSCLLLCLRFSLLLNLLNILRLFSFLYLLRLLLRHLFLFRLRLRFFSIFFRSRSWNFTQDFVLDWSRADNNKFISFILVADAFDLIGNAGLELTWNDNHPIFAGKRIRLKVNKFSNFVFQGFEWGSFMKSFCHFISLDLFDTRSFLPLLSWFRFNIASYDSFPLTVKWIANEISKFQCVFHIWWRYWSLLLEENIAYFQSLNRLNFSISGWMLGHWIIPRLLVEGLMPEQKNNRYECYCESECNYTEFEKKVGEFIEFILDSHVV